MSPPTRRTQPPSGPRRPRLSLVSCLALLLALLLAAPSARGIDLGRAFRRDKHAKDGDAAADSPEMSSEDALANAKKLVNDLNDAATGTVTSYQPGREKVPSTCNEIMAKSLVVANEEKAAVEAEKDAVVKAATLLSQQVDELTEKLKAQTEEVEKLGQSLEDEKQGRFKDKESVAEEIAGLQKEAAAALEDAQRKHAEQLRSASEKVRKNQRDAELALEKARSDHEQKLSEEMEKAKQNLEIMRNATTQTIDKLEQDFHDALAAKDKQLAKKTAEVESLRANTQKHLEEMEKKAEGKIASITAGAESARNDLSRTLQRKIDELKAEAQKERDAAEKAMQELKKSHAREIYLLNEKAEEKLKSEMGKMNEKITRIHKDTEGSINDAKQKLESERADWKAWERAYNAKADAARDREDKLKDQLEGMKAKASTLRRDVEAWTELHASQGYCNVTLLREDSKRFVMDISGNVGGALEGLHREVTNVVGNGWDQITVFVKGDLLPSIQMVVTQAHDGIKMGVTLAHDKALTLYDDHLAPVVEENLLPLYQEHVQPVYNEHILPVYKEHVSPVVKTIEGEAAVVIEKSQKEVRKARSGAAELVRQSSSNALGAMKEREIDSMLPVSVVSLLAHSARDGEWAVDMLSKALLIVFVLLFRSLVFRIIGFVFSVVWFFCPLRLFIGGRPKVEENGATPAYLKTRGGKTVRSNGKLKAKVH